MKIRVGVDGERSRLGRLEMDTADATRYGPVDVCATADPAAARAAGNAASDPLRPAGHAPFGAYVLKEVRQVADALMREWGRVTLVFEPRSGEARKAESLGRLVLVMHGGRTGDDGRLRTTSLGLRVDPDTLERVSAAAGRGEPVELDIREVPLGFWDRILFWRRRPSRGFDVAVTDTTSRTDRDDWSSSSSSSTRDDGYAGKGGQFGGAGASGSWDATRAGGAAAAGAAALGAGVVAASELGLGGGGEAPGESGGISGGGASDADTSSSSSESSGSESSTSY